MAEPVGQLLLLGAGRMGGALLAGWQKRGLLASPPVVIEPAPSRALRDAAARGDVVLNPGPGAGPAPTLAVVAVKPQSIEAALSDLKPHLGAATLVLSIAAGVRISKLKALLGKERPIVRAMPNLAAAVGEGITVACIASDVSESARALCTRLLEAVGEVAWIGNEDLLDAVTAVSGSGPAYVFLLAECLAAAGAAQGLSPALAERLARRTVTGAGALLAASDESAASLRESVTSPGGTTEAALKILMDPSGMQDLLTRAVAAATVRARALRGE